MSFANNDASPGYKKRTYSEGLRKSELPPDPEHMCGPQDSDGGRGVAGALE